MRLTNFHIDNDGITLNYNDKYLDLHNNFDFRSFHYDIPSRQLELIWTRSHEDWADEHIPAFKLVFRDVNYLKIRERDSTLPDTDDSCLSLIGFLPKDARTDFDSFVNSNNATNSDDLNILFQSDQGFKINCTHAELVELNEEIIYVPMINEGIEVWRPMWADNIKDNVYKLKSFSNYDPTDEVLKFNSGDLVVCEKQKKSEGQILVAVSKKK